MFPLACYERVSYEFISSYGTFEYHIHNSYLTGCLSATVPPPNVYGWYINSLVWWGMVSICICKISLLHFSNKTKKVI